MSAVTAFDASNTTYSGAQLNLIRNTVAKDCHPMEFELFVTVAHSAGLDPLRKQISAIVFDKHDPQKRRMSIITNIDGLRAIAARSGRYRPDENEPEFEMNPDAKSSANPIGLVKAVVKIYVADEKRRGGWKPVAGVAYWDEFAPLRDEAAGGYDWVETGETWPDTGRARKRKAARGSDMVRTLDPTSPWAKMPRIMLAKCAEAQALRRAFPECMSSLYEAAEMDQARAAELTPSERIGQFETDERLKRVAAPNGILFQLAPNTPLQSVPLGCVADRALEVIQSFTSSEQMLWFESANLQPLREFWARAPGDALALKKLMAARREQLEPLGQDHQPS